MNLLEDMLREFTDWVERRYGRVAAWIATIVGIAIVIGTLVTVLIYSFSV